MLFTIRLFGVEILSIAAEELPEPEIVYNGDSELERDETAIPFGFAGHTYADDE